MFRMYTDLGQLEPGQRAADRDISPDDIIASAQRVLHPYTLDVKEVAWWSVYEIGQRLSDTFDHVPTGAAEGPRVFITGDACHTHSPKAGQGMRDMEKLFAARTDAAEESDEARAQRAKFQQYFTKHARFTAGVETCYEPSLITQTRMVAGASSRSPMAQTPPNQTHSSLGSVRSSR